jgi:hypothetical protein
MSLTRVCGDGFGTAVEYCSMHTYANNISNEYHVEHSVLLTEGHSPHVRGCIDGSFKPELVRGFVGCV